MSAHQGMHRPVNGASVARAIQHGLAGLAGAGALCWHANWQLCSHARRRQLVKEVKQLRCSCPGIWPVPQLRLGSTPPPLYQRCPCQG